MKYYVKWSIDNLTYGPAGPYDTYELAEEHRLDIRGYEGVEHAWVYCNPASEYHEVI